MKLPIILVLVMSTLSSITYSQVNDASLVVGLESSFTFLSHSTNLKPTFGHASGITIQKPIGQFSVGLGFLSKDYTSNYQHRVATGTTEIRTSHRIGNSNQLPDQVIYNKYRRADINPKYFSVAAKVFYRLDCNCVYLFSGFEMDFLRQNKVIGELSRWERITEESPEEINQAVNVKDKVYNFNIGMGFNFPINKQLRFMARPSLVLSQKIISPRRSFRDKHPHYLNISFGIEYGLL